ncbi:hypothetical protein OG373_37980 [Streptomyces avidinii]|uniref:hypothetical protein n=1 Tax=Streptomyces avidinii TaxID=1895 RepID=UPI00386FCD20|nr:hypothetical protein OG373_37980 [Streptomyces avidinii]
MSKHSAKRTASLTLAAAAVLTLTLALVPSASADGPTGHQTPAAAPGSSVSGSPEGAFTRIADFYGSYIDAVYDGDGPTARSSPSGTDPRHRDGRPAGQEIAYHWLAQPVLMVLVDCSARFTVGGSEV